MMIEILNFNSFAYFLFSGGKRGVFDIEDLVALLQDDNAQDLCVISVPPENRFVDYLVIASGTSTRHIKAMSEYVKWLVRN